MQLQNQLAHQESVYAQEKRNLESMVSQKQAMFDNLENMCDHWSYYDQSSAKTHELEKKLLEHEMEMALDERVAQDHGDCSRIGEY